MHSKKVYSAATVHQLRIFQLCWLDTKVPPRQARAVVLEQVPLGLVKEEFLIPGRKFLPGRDWGGKPVDEKNYDFYYLFMQHIKTAQQGWFWMGMSICIHEINLQKTPETISRWCEIFAIIYMIFVWEELIVFGLVRRECEQNFENCRARDKLCHHVIIWFTDLFS